MTDKRTTQLDPPASPEQSLIELRYPQISFTTAPSDLHSRPGSWKMADNLAAPDQDSGLSESWTTLSDADYSLDEDICSETTDAPSLIDNTGSDDVRSLDDQSVGDHSSDAGAHDTQSDRSLSEHLSPQSLLNESTKTLKPASVGALKRPHLGNSLTLERPETEVDAEFTEVTQIIDTFGENEASEILQNTPITGDCDQVVGSVCMTISEDRIDPDRPFRLLYVGDGTARAEIMAKVGEVVMAGSRYRQSRHQPDFSRSHVISQSYETDSSKHSDLIPAKPQLIVDDCTTAASIKHDGAPDQIFLSLRNGSLYSSQWNGTEYEISSASRWSQPDLAVFFVAHGDHPVQKQKQQLAHAFISRHQTAGVIITESTSWASRFDALQIEHRSPHLRIEVQDMKNPGQRSVLRRLPIDLETFKCLESEQLNKNFACLRGLVDVSETKSAAAQSSLLSAPNHDPDEKSTEKSADISSMETSEPTTWRDLFREYRLRRTLMPAAILFLSLATSLMAFKVVVVLITYMLSFAGNVSHLSPAMTGSSQPLSSPTLTTLVSSPVIIQTASSAMITHSNTLPKVVATIHSQSDLAEMIASKSLHTTNTSEKFQIHSIGDCHIVVKTPRGFKARRKTTPFEVQVNRGDRILDSSLSKLFDGVYTVRIDREEAYGLLNVTIRQHKSPKLEEHQVEFGVRWLKLVGWKKAAQFASQQGQNNVEMAQIALSTAYEQLAAEVRFTAKAVSRKATRQAKQFLEQSLLYMKSAARLLEAESVKLQHVTNHELQEAYREVGKELHGAYKEVGKELQEAYKEVSKELDLAFQALESYAHNTNERSRALVERILALVDRTVERIQRGTPHIDLAEVRDNVHGYLRSEKLAKAQERATQLLGDGPSSWKQRRASRKARRMGCGKRGKHCKG